jgi:hypothetical protein
LGKSGVPRKQTLILTIDLKSLGERIKPAVEFLSFRLGEPLRTKQNQVQLSSVNARTAKLLLHKFLRRANLKEYRVTVVHPGLITVVKPTAKKKRAVEKPRSSAVPMTIPQYWGAAAIGGSVPRPRERKWKR